MSTAETSAPADFIRQKVAEDMRTGKWEGRVVTRFPPEPNGFLHIGHAKSICLNFGVAREFGGVCHLRFDDTNPAKEESKYVKSIEEDIKWLGWDWGEHLYFASDYFDTLYEYALKLIRANLAYVCDLSPEEIRSYRGSLTEPGRESPYRDRTVEENLDLFGRMKAGEFEEGSRVLRAKIDMAAPNLNLRDPVIYRIMHKIHHRTGDTWCVYPLYDFTHGQSDSIEKVTHSLCSMEFEDHRPLYDWFLEALEIYHPEQTEFARLNLNYTIMSKRRLLKLVEEGHVDSWDDPRMPTLSGMRRRGYRPSAIRDFCGRVGVAKRHNVVEISLLEHCVREDLNKSAPRVMAVLNPLKVVIENFPEGEVIELEAVNNPEDPSAGTRKVPFSRTLYIERDDFREDPPRKYFRLAPGREVRLRYGYFVTCTEVVRNKETGEVVEILCNYDPETKGGQSPDGRKIKGTIHWVSADHALDAEARLYDRLFKSENPESKKEDVDLISNLNPTSLEVAECKVEPSLVSARPGSIFQFERIGYFCVDLRDSSDRRLVFNRTVALRDSWKKIEKKGN